MPIRLFNSLTRKKEELKPLIPGKVRIYTCGPTVYDVAHIGNFRAFLFEDLLKRYLRLKGLKVFHVMNITDVDDRTIRRSQEKHISIAELTKKYTDLFFKDLNTLKVKPADIYPRATEHIASMIRMIETLIKKGHAYVTEDGSVYFAIDTYPEYGQLTRLDRTRQQTVARIATDEYAKDNPQDFSLWKSWKEEDGDVYWESPWGRGRPGWHIECSVMSIEYLGSHFDIHCGGVDNMFPHHENEIAQSVCATGEPFVNIWMHNEHLLVDGGKMSKSLGNYYRISDLIRKGFTPEALRYILLGTHYRSKVNFSLEKRHEAQRVVQRISDIYDRLLDLVGQEVTGDELPADYTHFEAAMDDDLDAPKALGIFFNWIRKTNSRLADHSLTLEEASKGLNFIRRFNSVFDIISQRKTAPPEVLQLVKEREAARSRKDWSEADRLREIIREKGWIVEDTPTGSKCKSIVP